MTRPAWAGYDPVVKLPGWIKDNETSVRADVAPYLGVPPEESFALVASAAALGAAQLAWDPLPDEARAFRDPLPRSTSEALARLRGGGS